MVDISILIPVYNVEDYLPRCLESVFKQEFNGSFEVICVNDGSTDGSGKILEDYAKQYKNIKIINQENQGLSVARNSAIKQAQGKYTLFIDSDDYILENTLQSLFDFAQEHDSEVVIFDYYTGKPDTPIKDAQYHTMKNILQKYGNNTFNIDTAEPWVYRFMPVYTWAKFYLTEFIKNFKFEKGIINQDLPHWTEVYTKAERINYLPVPFYFYTIYRKNATSIDNGTKVFDMFSAQQKTLEILKNNGYFSKLRNIFYLRLGRVFVSRIQLINPELREKFVEQIKKFEFDIDYEEYFKEDFYPLEKNNIRLLKYIREHNYEEIRNHMENAGLWSKYPFCVSVIMPVYNVEKYLVRCMKSVTRQTFPTDRYEVICVNDGSTDNSLEILERYAEQFPNIKIINQKNSGPAAARNRGIKEAQGKYVLFIDSDDFIAVNALEILYKYVEQHKSDVVIFDFYRDIPGVKNPKIRHQKQVAQKYKDSQFNAKIAEPFVYRFIPMAPWNKIYSLDLIKDIQFPIDTCYDDIPFWNIVYTKAERINYLPYALYFYDISRDTRLTASKDRKVFDIFKTYNHCRETLKKSGYFEKFKLILYAHATSSIMNYLKAVKEDLRPDYIDEIKKFEIDVSVEEFLKEDFYKFEYENFKSIKYIQNTDYDTAISYLKEHKYVS